MEAAAHDYSQANFEFRPFLCSEKGLVEPHPSSFRPRSLIQAWIATKRMMTAVNSSSNPSLYGSLDVLPASTTLADVVPCFALLQRILAF